MTWEGTEQRQSDKLASAQYLLATGSFTARDEAELDAFLAHLGSRIVFLIDWNHMRKRLRLFVSKARAIEILDVGRRQRLWASRPDRDRRRAALAEAVEYAAGQHLRYGQRLDELISEDHASEFLKEALRLACVGPASAPLAPGYPGRDQDQAAPLLRERAARHLRHGGGARGASATTSPCSCARRSSASAADRAARGSPAGQPAPEPGRRRPTSS